MRVLLAHSRYRFPGGEERHLDLLEASLADAGVDVRRYECQSAIPAGVRETIRLGAGLTYRLSARRSLAVYLRKWPADVVHFHNLMPLLTPAAIHAARQSGAATLLTVHNYRLFCPAGTLMRGGRLHEDCVEGSSLLCGLRNARGSLPESIAYGLAIELQRRLRLVSRWLDALVAPSAFMARMLARAGFPTARTSVIPYGVPLRASVARESEFALFVGRLSPEKGIRTLLEASRLAPDVPVRIAGTGPLESELRARLPENVRYEGQLDSTRLQALVDRCAFGLLPSECYDNLPFAGLEFAASGKAVVASDVGGLPEVVLDGRTGLLVPPGSPSALARATAELWRAPEQTQRMGAAAHARAAESFELGNQTRKIVSLYSRLRQARSRAGTAA